MKFFLCTLGLVLIIEGLPYFISPLKTKQWLEIVAHTPEKLLRIMGFFFMILGLVIVFLSQKSGLF